MKGFFNLTIGKCFHVFQRRLLHFSTLYASENLRSKFSYIGENAQLSSDLKVEFPERVSIGDWVYVGPLSQFHGRGGLTIHDHVIIGPQVTVMTAMHNYRNAQFVPYDELEILNPVKIGVACWIGFGVIIMPGVTLGMGCIVGSGSVVTKSFPNGSIIAGNPATIVGTRDLKQFSDHLATGNTYLKHKSERKLEKVERMAEVRKDSGLN